MLVKKNIFSPTATRVCMRTDPKMNAEIRNQTIKNLKIFKNCEEPEISERITKLNQEWDTERVIEFKAALLIILSSYLGIKTSKFWFLLTGACAVFMLQHVFCGWTPLLPLIRKWGVRTADEIHNEKTALKLKRGEFSSGFTTEEEALSMSEKQ